MIDRAFLYQSGEIKQFVTIKNINYLSNSTEIKSLIYCREYSNNILSTFADICLIRYKLQLECVGSVEHGLTAMCWSTDQELVVLATGKN